MFHLSQSKITCLNWIPRLPRQEENEDWRAWNNSIFFEPPIPRICVSPTIHHCLLAMGMFIEDPDKWTELYVYRPGICKLIPAQLVHDAHITQEHLITKPVEMKFIRKIKVRAKDSIEYRWFDRGIKLQKLDFEISIT